MKRLLLILPLLCLAAGDDTEGWKVTRGSWNRQRGSFHTNGGIVVYPCEGRRAFSLTFNLTVNKWETKQGDPAYVCVFWAFKGTTPSEPNWDDRLTLSIRESETIFWVPPKETITMRIPTNRRVPISITSMPSRTDIAIGKSKFTTCAQYTSPDKLGLMVQNADVRMDKLRVRFR